MPYPLENSERLFEGMLDPLRTMSALPPKADIGNNQSLNIGFVPKRGIGNSSPIS
jgi:hypothetical protein